MTVNGREQEVHVTSAGYFHRALFNSIYAYELFDNVEVNVYNGNVRASKTFTFSLAKYADKLDFSNKAHLKNYALTILTHEMDRIVKENSENIDFVEEFPEKNRYKFIEDICIREQYNQVVRAIEQMDDIYGTTLFLVYCKDMTVNEIAEMMDVPAKTVYTRLARGKQTLRDSLKGDK